MAGLMTVAIGRDPMSAPAGLAEAPAIHTHPRESAILAAPISALRRALASPATVGDSTTDEYREPQEGEPHEGAPDPLPAAGPVPGATTPDSSAVGPGGTLDDEDPFEPLHDRLEGEWARRNWRALAAAARRHLQARGPSPSLHGVVAAAVQFFRPRSPGFQPGDVERFLGGFRPEAMSEPYFGEAKLEAERGRLADDALALHCLGMLGRARFDYVGALRAIEALSVSLRLWEMGGDELGIPPALIDRILEMDVVLPAWSFEIDPCRGPKEGWPAESPLERKIAGVARRDSGPRPKSDCICTTVEEPCMPTDPCCAKVNYYIADLLELRDWTHRYKAGDLAYIENIAAGETRSRDHEMKRTRELFSETEITHRQSETRDLQVTDRASLKREIERQREMSVETEASATGSYNAAVYKGSISATASFAGSASDAVRQAQENAIETVRKAVSEIEKETRTKRSEKITTEETEKNVHAFTNTTDEALVTKYFWVTKECRAQLYSYGKQMVAEFIVPEPARLYERLAHERREAQIAERIKKPRGVKPPVDLTAKDLNEKNYEQLCEEWGVKDPPAWPPPTKQISDSEVDEWDRDGAGISLDTLRYDIPAGYEAIAMDLGIVRLEFMSDKNPRKIELYGPDTLYAVAGGTPKSHVDFNPHLTGHHEVRIEASHTTLVDVWVTMSLVRQPGVLETWQKTVFRLLWAEIEKAMAPWDDYEKVYRELRRELIEAEQSRHPFFNREIERTELKRAVIYLMCQDFSVNGAMIRKAEPCGFPEIDRTATDEKGYDWYFWDRLIDWKRMAYAFFDYFWNPMCDWPQRFDPDEPDALFKAFLRAGYARVLVPVSPAMHKDFLWYLATHEKWNHQGPPFGDQDPRWRNVVFELKHANEAAMTAREGRLDVTNGSNTVTIKGSDRYYNPAGTGLPDLAMIALDIDREVYIDGEVYLIVAIALNPGSPSYNILTPDSGWWDLTLDRVYVGATGTGRLYAMGAKAVAPPFSFDMPTELIWAGDKGKCLPAYPLPPCVP
jgi:hypothetical protein